MSSHCGRILWLASYPRSGNTWFRAFYTNLIMDKDTPARLDELDASYLASSRRLFDDYAGVEASDLTQDEIDRLRPRIYEIIARDAKETIPIKIHDACIQTANGDPLVPRRATWGAIYFLRNPLDVAVSFARFSACSIDKSIANMADESFRLGAGPNRIGSQFRQRLLSWNNHVTSWLSTWEDRVHVMRYEDMVLRPMETFSGAARFAQLPDDPARIQRALKFSEFGELQRQEKAQGFKEKPQNTAVFFRQGKVGSWRESLTTSQVQRLIADHGAVMKKFGYLNDRDEPLF
jgi:aryl sulfotransferase